MYTPLVCVSRGLTLSCRNRWVSLGSIVVGLATKSLQMMTMSLTENDALLEGDDLSDVDGLLAGSVTTTVRRQIASAARLLRAQGINVGSDSQELPGVADSDDDDNPGRGSLAAAMARIEQEARANPVGVDREFTRRITSITGDTPGDAETAIEIGGAE